MKIAVQDIRESPRDTRFEGGVGEINETLAEAYPADFQLEGAVDVEIHYYRSGEDLFFQGSFEVDALGMCGRCLERYPFTLRDDFRFVLKLASDDVPPGKVVASDTPGIFLYGGEDVDLSGPIREEVLVSLPTRPLCNESCAGLCAGCGANKNRVRCECRDEWIGVDPRLEVLRELGRRMR